MISYFGFFFSRNKLTLISLHSSFSHHRRKAMIAEHGNGTGNSAREYMNRVPQLQLALKVLKPFRQLKGFDRDLENVTRILGECYWHCYVCTAELIAMKFFAA